jgi:hypothetical protein
MTNSKQVDVEEEGEKANGVEGKTGMVNEKQKGRFNKME